MTAPPWRDVRTDPPPMDGTAVICFFTHEGTLICKWRSGGWRDVWLGDLLYERPTHWMPLPEPPKEAT